MKWLACIFLAALAFGIGWFTKPSHTETVTEEKVDTVTNIITKVRVDTFLRYLPIPYITEFTGDSVEVNGQQVARERKVYQDSTYTAVVSGIDPGLDMIAVYPRTVTKTVTNDIFHTTTQYIRQKRRWSLGITAGYGFSKDGLSPAVVVGVSYRIW